MVISPIRGRWAYGALSPQRALTICSWVPRVALEGVRCPHVSILRPARRSLLLAPSDLAIAARPAVLRKSRRWRNGTRPSMVRRSSSIGLAPTRNGDPSGVPVLLGYSVVFTIRRRRGHPPAVWGNACLDAEPNPVPGRSWPHFCLAAGAGQLPTRRSSVSGPTAAPKGCLGIRARRRTLDRNLDHGGNLLLPQGCFLRSIHDRLR